VISAPTKLLDWTVIALFKALTAPHGPDRFLELVDPTWSVSEVRAKVIGVRRSAPGSVTLTLAPNRNWLGFQAGQHVALTVDVDGVRRTRCYSPACSAYREDGVLEFTVAAEPGGVVSGHLNRVVEAGAVVGLSQARGQFLLPTTLPEHVLLISGGSGITPVMSMLRTLCDRGYGHGRGQVTFLHYARTAADLAYRDELAVLAAAHPAVCLLRSYTRGAGGELSGRFVPEHLPRAVDDRTAAWVCGPAGLVEAVRTYWGEIGREDALQTEQFTTPTPAMDVGGDEPYGLVRFAASGHSTANTGAVLLEQAESVGLRPEFGCRMGICMTCTSRKIAGSVRHIHTGELSGEPDSQIQICSTVPVGDVTIEL